MKKQITLFVALLVVVPTLMAAPASKSMEPSLTTFDRAGHFQRMSVLNERLSASSIELAQRMPIEITVSAQDREFVRKGQLREQKLMVGVVRETSIPMVFERGRMAAARAALHETFGATMKRSDGSFVWEGVIVSPEASAVRVHLTDVDLPPGSELFVYTADGMAFGPYTGRGPNGSGEFWTNTVAGSRITIQLQGGVEGSPRFTVAGVGHLTPEFMLAANLLPRFYAAAAQPNCSFNASCVVGAACVANDSAVTTAKNAVAHILFASGAYLYICTGGLVADSDTNTTIPYFLTANHCISRSSEASSLETFFFYTASCGSCPDPGTASTTGSTIVSSASASDYTLLRLSQNAPSGAAYLGWESAAVANTNGAHLYRLSHPQGAPQSYSTHDVDTSKGTCRSWPRGGWIYSRDILGATEGGSSGSPVVNAAGKIVGQLSGACGTNVNDNCDEVRNATVDGAFAAYYTNVAQWLGGGSTPCTDNDGDGFCVSEGDCNDNNNRIYPGAPDGGKAGRDGIDNDCDGKIDK